MVHNRRQGHNLQVATEWRPRFLPGHLSDRPSASASIPVHDAESVLRVGSDLGKQVGSHQWFKVKSTDWHLVEKYLELSLNIHIWGEGAF